MSRAVPPLLAIAEGRRVRLQARRAAAQSPKEIALHMAVAGTLRRSIRPDWRWSHYPAGELRNPRTAGKLKRMGVMPGWPDLLLLSPRGLLHGLELKRAGADLSDAQEIFERWAITHGVPYSVAWSTDEALTILRAWGCLRHGVGSNLADNVAGGVA